MNNKKGITLIELIVAMAIFSIVITLSVGTFITLSRMKGLTATMRESQQKIRIATETITRYSRQAEDVVVFERNGIKYLDLYFNIYPSSCEPLINDDIALQNCINGKRTIIRFSIEPSPKIPAQLTLYQQSCLPGNGPGVGTKKVACENSDGSGSGFSGKNDMLGNPTVSDLSNSANAPKLTNLIYLLDSSSFSIDPSEITSLNIILDGKITTLSGSVENAFYSDHLYINTKVLLENLK